MPEVPRLIAIDARRTAVVTSTFTAADAWKGVRFAAASKDGSALNTVLPKYTPMHPTQVREPFHRPGWVYEEKVDGWRILAYKDGPSLRLLSRNGRNVDWEWPGVGRQKRQSR
jgi:ATP-dependent DNA ligase